MHVFVEEPDDAVVESDFTLAGGRRGARELLERFADLDGLFVASDLMAAGAVAELGAAGRSVPDHVAVVGFDDFAIARELSPTLSTVVNPVTAMAEVAVELLLEQLAGGSDPTDGATVRRSHVFDAELVVRASSGPPSM